MVVRNLQFIDSDIFYQGYKIRMVCGDWTSQGYVEFIAESDFDFGIFDDTLNGVLDIIDYRIKNGLTDK